MCNTQHSSLALPESAAQAFVTVADAGHLLLASASQDKYLRVWRIQPQTAAHSSPPHTAQTPADNNSNLANDIARYAACSVLHASAQLSCATEMSYLNTKADWLLQLFSCMYVVDLTDRLHYTPTHSVCFRHGLVSQQQFAA